MTTVAAARMPAVWFGESLARIRLSAEEGEGNVSVVELTAERGHMPPLHVHDEDEALYVLDGAVTVFVGEEERALSAGDALLAPRGRPHTFRAESAGVRMLVVTTGSFERLVRAVGRPARYDGVPRAADGPPSAADAALFTRAAAANGTEILGPPGMLPADL